MWNCFEMCKSGGKVVLTVSNRCLLILALFRTISWSGRKYHPLDFSLIRIIQAGIRNLLLSFPACMFSLSFNWHTYAVIWRCVWKVVCGRRLQFSRNQRTAMQNGRRNIILDCSDAGTDISKTSNYYEVFQFQTIFLSHWSLVRVQMVVCLDLRVCRYMFVPSFDSGCRTRSVWRSSSSSFSSNWRETLDMWTHTAEHWQCRYIQVFCT